jgi:hypothetical protein
MLNARELAVLKEGNNHRITYSTIIPYNPSDTESKARREKILRKMTTGAIPLFSKRLKRPLCQTPDQVT